MKRRDPVKWILLPLLLLFFFGGNVITFYTDYLWFQEVGYTSAFWRVLTAKLVLFAAGAVAVFLLLWINLRIARSAVTRLPWVEGNVLAIPERHQIAPIVNRLLPLGLIAVSLFAGLISAGLWEDALRFLHPTPFGKADPLFGKDIAFYVFELPMLRALYTGVQAALVLCVIVVALFYVFDEKVAASDRGVIADPRVKPHVLALLGLLLLLKAWGYWLSPYDLLYSERGVAYGASYIDVHVVLPVLRLLLVVAALSGAFVIASGYRRGWKAATTVVAVWLGISLLGGGVLPSAIQRVRVAPNELSMEQPYIKHNINFTRAAYNLENVQEREFAAEQGLTARDLEANRLTVENIRLWDHRPLLASYEQLQEIRTYYDFSDVDEDRYTIDGKYRQVMLAAREISSERLPSRLWINERLTYTHGYGVVVSPVNRILGEGLPDFLVKNIPPTGHPDLKVERPEIYYGENLNDYVFTKTRAREFNYPAGEKNVYSSYEGSGGVPVGGFWRRLAFALRFQSLPILLNTDITAESRVMFYRRVQERLSRIAPFLLFDRDPYIVLSQGKLLWICDAYTRTDMYPYSQPVRGLGNYLRNSIKAVVDAYNGTVVFYVADPADPLIRSYARIFPGLFRPLESMDADLQRHVRYPQTLFQVQARLYSLYHMTDPQVFYNKEDVWEIPRGDVSTALEEGPVVPPGIGPPGQAVPAALQTRGSMEPYYTIMKLPDGAKEEFIQLIPFTPAQKDNLRAWMCARNDPPHYGRLLVYNFPKAKLVYGPSQINARIEQESHISQQLSLWRQGGSDVIRGNLLIVPIEQSLLYVQPLYLKATQGEIPELKRVITAYGDQIVMETNLQRSLAALFGEGMTPPSDSRGSEGEEPARPSVAPSRPTLASRRDLAREALQQLQRARESYRRDDWARFGEELKKLEETLRRLNAPENAAR